MKTEYRANVAGVFVSMATCGRDGIGRDAMLDSGLGTSSLSFVMYISNTLCL